MTHLSLQATCLFARQYPPFSTLPLLFPIHNSAIRSLTSQFAPECRRLGHHPLISFTDTVPLLHWTQLPPLGSHPHCLVSIRHPLPGFALEPSCNSLRPRTPSARTFLLAPPPQPQHWSESRIPLGWTDPPHPKWTVANSIPVNINLGLQA